MTETAMAISCLDPVDAIEKPAAIGKPSLFCDFKVIKTDGSEAKVGENGDLCLRGASITPRYWNNEKATHSAFCDGWLNSGDIACRDDQGFYYIKDRSKDMYISGGENIYPAEIENVLFRLSTITEVAVVGAPDEKWGEVGCAFVTLKAGEQLDLQSLQAFCDGKLAKYKWPRYLVIKEELPHNATGKVLKHVLRDVAKQELNLQITT
jgi:fatty-acyl-CoA synthase